MQPRPRPVSAAAAAVVAGLMLSGGPAAHADNPTTSPSPGDSATTAPPASTPATASDSAPSDTSSSAGSDSGSAGGPEHVDPHAAGLKLAHGAKLAPVKVLDIKTVIEDGNGDERRSETNKDVTFDLQTEVNFTKDSSKLSGDALDRVAAIADEIDDQNATRVKVFGFTDNLGSNAHGVALSRKRAEAVRDALKKNLKSDVVFDVRGYGEDFPIADNSTEAGRKKNRRVEITFPKTED